MRSVDEIDALLPQTQCQECEFAGCRPYAEALVKGTVSIDRCPPGGTDTLKALGNALQIDSRPYLEAMQAKTRAPSAAFIVESECIGCTKCIQACPVDAIVGSGKLMHSVLLHECTGCGLCVEPCPVDCIEMRSLPKPAFQQDVARARFKARKVRLLHEEDEKTRLYREKRILNAHQDGLKKDKIAKQDFILQALKRVQDRKQ